MTWRRWTLGSSARVRSGRAAGLAIAGCAGWCVGGDRALYFNWGSSGQAI